MKKKTAKKKTRTPKERVLPNLERQPGGWPMRLVIPDDVRLKGEVSVKC